MESNSNEIIFEQSFSANIPKEKQIILLDLIEKTVELTDTVYPINGITSGKLINMHLKKVNDNVIYMSGFYNIDTEKRCLDGEIYIEDNKVYIDSLITRIGDIPTGQNKVYRFLDKFTLLKTKTKQQTICSNKIVKNIYPVIKNKTKLK